GLASRHVTLPRRIVVETRTGMGMPSEGLFSDLEAISLASAIQLALVSTTHRFAGSPSAIGRPWPGSLVISAGRSDITLAAELQSCSQLMTNRTTMIATEISRHRRPGRDWSNWTNFY